jgi:TDG/mug DNA glycosylase family protein
MGFTRAELEAVRGRGVPDLVGDGVRLLFVGINPGLWTAAAQAHFAKRGNRFYPALYLAGLSQRQIDASEGMTPEDANDLRERGIGISNLVNKATARADELTTPELEEGAAQLGAKVGLLRPRVVVMLGLTAYRIAFARPRATMGWQSDGLAGADLLLAGNPSGLNAHQSTTSLAAAFAVAADRAGISRLRTPESASRDQQTASD